MKTCSLIVVGAVIMVFSHFAGANQADDTTIRITGQTAGATPFISKVSLAVSNMTLLKSIQFTITPNPAQSRDHCQALMRIRTSWIVGSKTYKPAKSCCRSMDFTMDTIIPSD